MKDIEGQLSRLLNQQKLEAESYIDSSASEVIYQAFERTFNEINGSSLTRSQSGSDISIDFNMLASLIDRWINELHYFVDDVKLQLNMYDPVTYEDINRMTGIQMRVESDIIGAYIALKTKLAAIKAEFSNVAKAYNSHMETAFNHLTNSYTTYKDQMGDFSTFTNVTVYMHGTEASGEVYFDTIRDTAQAGDIAIYKSLEQKRKFYVLVNKREGPLTLSRAYDECSIKQTKAYKGAKGRIHMVCKMEKQDGCPQKTSTHLLETLMDLGLMYGEKKFTFYGHRYGGKRSLKFALDVLTYVQALTTIQSPYSDKENRARVVDEALPGKIGTYVLDDGDAVGFRSGKQPAHPSRKDEPIEAVQAMYADLYEGFGDRYR